MKHGEKAKSKKASKASGKKSSKAGTSIKSAAKSSKAKKQTVIKKIEKPSGKSGDNGKPRPRITPESITFTNPLVANAFKRAVKKYPNAFRRLTD
ncbi:MAG TPA: hypothetical protein VLV78_12470 [Thermoanaerobaculia bacterium]|nr:hypothetical protein [Thermoanaerobaculia bacterium]